MEILVQLSPKDIEDAIKAYLTLKGYEVSTVRFHIDPVCPGSRDPREPHGPTLTHAACVATRTNGG